MFGIDEIPSELQAILNETHFGEFPFENILGFDTMSMRSQAPDSNVISQTLGTPVSQTPNVVFSMEEENTRYVESIRSDESTLVQLVSGNELTATAIGKVYIFTKAFIILGISSFANGTRSVTFYSKAIQVFLRVKTIVVLHHLGCGVEPINKPMGTTTAIIKPMELSTVFNRFAFPNHINIIWRGASLLNTISSVTGDAIKCGVRSQKIFVGIPVDSVH
jgi:hypothetical protein